MNNEGERVSLKLKLECIKNLGFIVNSVGGHYDVWIRSATGADLCFEECKFPIKATLAARLIILLS